MNPVWNGSLISSLREALYEVKGLDDVPGLVKRILQEDLWREFYDEVLEDIVRHKTFESFVTSKPPEGLGTTVKKLNRICSDDTEALDAIDRAMQRKPEDVPRDPSTGRYTVSDNVTDGMDDRGNTETYALRRLRANRPDLHEQVLEGEKSAHSAMVEAGFRKKYVQVPSDPDRAVEALRRHFDDEDIEYIRSHL